MENKVTRYIFETKDDWKAFRQGLFTASQINRIMATSQLSVGAITYILQLIVSTDAQPKPDIFNSSVEWGNEQEPQAVLRFANDFFFDINDDNFIYTSVGGFVFFEFDGIAGGTPDIILSDRIVEIKCPNCDTHLYYKHFVNEDNFQKELPVYYDQMQFNMFLTSRANAIFMSFDPRHKIEAMQAHYINIKADGKRQKEIIDKIYLAAKMKNKLQNNL
jgi:YqaJ-like viral recombinase domain